jgi:DNA-binding NarL/FixJ family response regulator
MFHSRVSQSISDLKSTGTELKLIVNRSVDKLIEKLSEAGAPKLVIIDLSLRDLDIETATKVLRDAFATTSIVAYGPHVAGALLHSANEAGIDAVYTRGQFDHRMTEIISDSVNLA